MTKLEGLDVERLADALHATNAGAICPTEQCDYHWQMAKAAIAALAPKQERSGIDVAIEHANASGKE